MTHACLIQYTCLKRPLKKKIKNGFQDRLSLNAGQKYCRMLSRSILQYFRPSLSYHLSSRTLFCLFLTGRLRQVLLQSLTHISITFFLLDIGKQCKTRSDAAKIESILEMFIFITLVSNKCYYKPAKNRRIAKDFAANILRVWMYM